MGARRFIKMSKQTKRFVNTIASKKVRNIFVLGIVALTLIVSAILVYADIHSETNHVVLTADQLAIVEAKKDFAEKSRIKAANRSSTKGANLSKSFEQIMEDKTLSYYDRQWLLNEIGYYTFADPNYNVDYTNNDPSLYIDNDVYLEPEMFSNETHVTLNAVSIYYNTSNVTWTLYASGYWNNVNDWDDTGNMIPWSVGTTRNTGSPDYVGIVLTDTYGSSDGMYVMANNTPDQSAGRLWWNEKQNYGYNSAGLMSDSQGAIFAVQDYIYITESHWWGSYRVAYIGHSFSATVIYNGAFENYHGNAKIFYAHTWDSAQINGIGIGLDNISVNWSSGKNHWDTASAGSTPF
jgi:hypothetical protein